MKRTVMRSLAVAAAVALVATGCATDDPAPSETGAATQELTPVKMAIFPVTVQVPFLYAEYMGYYEDEGLDVSWEVLQNSQDAIVLLSQGQLDVIPGSTSAGLLNTIASGLDVRIVGSYSTTAPPPSCEECENTTPIMVRASLLEEIPDFSYEDMEGRRLAAAGGIGAAPSYQLGTFLEAGGLTLNDVTWVPMNTAVRFLRATMRAAAELQGNYIADNPDAVASIVEYLGFDLVDVEKSAVSEIPLDLAYRPATLAHFQELMFQAGNVLTFEQPLSTLAVVDTTLGAEAFRTLGSR